MSVSLLLRCHDLEQTRGFYGSTLGFDVRDGAEGTLTAELHDGGLIFTTLDLWKSAPVFSGTIYFTMPDVDGYYARVKDRATVAWPLQDMPYGTREFAIIDCNGYCVAFQRQD